MEPEASLRNEELKLPKVALCRSLIHCVLVYYGIYDADVMAASHTFWILLAGLTGSGILADLDQMSNASFP